MRRNDPQRPGPDQHQEQPHRQPHPDRQGADHLAGVPLAAGEVEKGVAEAGDDTDQHADDEDLEEFHRGSHPVGPGAGSAEDPYYRRVTIRIAVGQRVFAPSWLMTGLTVVLCLLFLSLGRWQWGRAEQKRELWAQFDRGAGEVVALGTRTMTELPRYARVRVEGRWEPRRQFLLDNRTHEGRAGYEVLTPLWLDDGRVVLVNRGWVPFGGYRDQLPDVSAELADLVAATSGAATARVAVSGRLDELPSAGLAGGRAAPRLEGPWPRVTAFPRPAELAASLGLAPPPGEDASTTGAGGRGEAVAGVGSAAASIGGVVPRLERRLLLLDAREPRGYVRDWKPGGRGPEQNWSYAIQWWSFGVVLLGLYVGLNLRRAQEESR